MFSARHQHVVSFSLRAYHFLATFSKVHEFVGNSIFSPRSACFVICALGAPLFCDFQQSARVQTSVFSPRSARFVIFALAHHFLATFNKVHEFVQNSVFSPRSARFTHFRTGRTTFYTFQQSAPVCTKQCFQPEIRTFCHFCSWLTTFEPFLAKCTSFCKTMFSARHQHVLSFSHWAHHFLATFSKVHEFVRNSIFSPRSACFVICALGAPLFCDFQQSARVFTNQRFQLEISTFYHFRTGCTTFQTLF